MFSAILNTTRVYKISLKEQFIIGYGGLRGAVGFSLATIINDDNPFKGVFLTATLAIVYFTVFIQGSTIKFFVRKLNIERKNESPKQIFDYINERTTDQIMAGIESILGGVHGHVFLESLRKFDDKYTKKILIHKKAEHDMTLRFQQIALDEHYARLYGPSVLVHQNKVNLILKPDIRGFDNKALTLEDDHHVTNGVTSPDYNRKLLLEAFEDPSQKGKLRKSRRMSIHPDDMCQQINRQRERARSICLAALSDSPLSDVPEGEDTMSDTRVIKRGSICQPNVTNNGHVENLNVHPQNGPINGDQIRKAYKIQQFQRQNSIDFTTRL
jgi:hypothetical protein